MMVVLRAFALLAVGIGAGALHHVVGDEITFDIGSNPVGPLPTGPAEDAQGTDPAPESTGEPAAVNEAAVNEASEGGDLEASEQASDPSPDAPVLTYEELTENIDVRGARLIYEMMEQGNASIVDARRPEDFLAGHIPGAVNLMPMQFHGIVPLEVEFMDPAMPVMIYCEGGTCTDSIAVGQKLREIGFQRLHIFDDGYPAWVEAGYETAEGLP